MGPNYGIDANGFPITTPSGVPQGANAGGLSPKAAASATNPSQNPCPPPLVVDPTTGGCVSSTQNTQNGSQTPNPSVPTPPAPPVPGPGGSTTVTPPPAPGTFTTTTPAGSNPFQGAAYNSDPSKAAMTYLNSPFGKGASSQQIVDWINSSYGGSSGQPAVYKGQGPNGTDIISFATPNGYLAQGPDGTWGWNPRNNSGGGPQQPLGPLAPDAPNPYLQYLTGAGSQPPPNWSPTNFSMATPTYQTYQFQPDSTQPLTSDLIKQLLSTTSMSPEVVAQMKENAKDTALSGQQQLTTQMNQDAATRGVYGGGALSSNLANLDMSTLGNISTQYRNVDITKAVQDQTDKLNAVSASNAFEQQLLAEQQAQSTADYQGWTTKEQAVTDAFNQWSANMGFQSDASKTAFANWLAQQGIDLSFLTQGENVREFDLNNQLNVAKWLAGGA
jgi:hypothetical protein